MRRGFEPCSNDPKVGEVTCLDVTLPVQCTDSGIFYVKFTRREYVHGRTLSTVKKQAIETMKRMAGGVAIPFTRVYVESDYSGVDIDRKTITRLNPAEFENDRGKMQSINARYGGEEFLRQLDDDEEEDLRGLVAAARAAVDAVGSWLQKRELTRDIIAAWTPKLKLSGDGPGEKGTETT